ncbi:class IV lanthionine synthetase LanL [Allokutzneria albata]|uniref:non-specific serine/threonine protein kinase n=1 Tax=Allokutzneria albata TaxID=211114 RepID=A0A1G9VYB2_ALLAB|nr:class IV lanthionine synthetase LanL [Allokutzneria albata]SDM77289.1 Serine/threonine protein kinase [Allokutzneria albata]
MIVASTDQPIRGAVRPSFVTLTERLLAELGEQDRIVHLGEQWCSITPPEAGIRRQGWKLHLSATTAHAERVLERAVRVLAEFRIAFKFAASRAVLRDLNGPRCTRSGAGKFITVYPADDAQLRVLAHRLHRATAGLSGPRILSDRPYRTGSLVHCRYGCFLANPVLSPDGDYRDMLLTPDGGTVEDRRDPWFSAPAWATWPFPESRKTTRGTGSGGVLLGGRFLAVEAIRHANKGGVYRAVDTETGETVVVKQARAHVGDDGAGGDVRDIQRHEAAMLRRFEPLGVTPRFVAEFSQDGDDFLAQELIEGQSLRRWLAATGTPGLGWPKLLAVTRDLMALLARVHADGLVLGDLTPGNVMVRPDGKLTLIDVELAAEEGTALSASGTPGYAPYEQLSGSPRTAAADRYALGAVLVYLATGAEPVHSGQMAERMLQRKRWLDLVCAEHAVLGRLRPLIDGLQDADPDRRWTLTRAGQFLDAVSVRGSVALSAPHEDGIPDADTLVTDGVEHLVETMRPEAKTLWPVVDPRQDACSAWPGAAGGLTAVLAAAEATGDVRYHGALRAGADWLLSRMRAEAVPTPGLLHGRAGTLLVLHRAGRVLGDSGLADEALGWAHRLPTRWPNLDLATGTAGAGLAMCALTVASGDPGLLGRIEAIAEHLAHEARLDDHGLTWAPSKTYAARSRGGASYGLAHGTAGIATFLLSAAATLGRGDLLELAGIAGRTMAGAAVQDGSGVRWPDHSGTTGQVGDTWTAGTAGVGSFLVRLWRATGERDWLELAERAALSVWQRRWVPDPSSAHGLAGRGEFLLDLHAATGEPRYRLWAERLGRIIGGHAYRHDGRWLVPGAGWRRDDLSHGTGMAGSLGFLVRLRHGVGAPWLPPGGRPLTAGAHASLV